MSIDFDEIGEIPPENHNTPANPGKKKRGTRSDKGKPRARQGTSSDNKRQKSAAKIKEDTKAKAKAEAETPNITGGKPRPASEPPEADPFDVTKYRRSQSFDQLAKGAQYLDQIPIGRPAPDRWYRAHPGQEYDIEVRLYQPSKATKGELVAHPYLIPASADPEFVQAVLRHTRKYALYYMCDGDNDVFCWPIVLANEITGTWHASPESAMKQAERAKKEWVQIYREGGVYVSLPSPGKRAEPKYHEVGGTAYLKLIFRSHIMSGFDHPTAIDVLGLWESSAADEDGE